MNVSAYEKEADVNRHFYIVNFKSMSSVNYKFAGTHIHHSIELVFCYAGSMKAIINSNEIILSAGEILIINPLDWHYYEYIGDASCFILVVSKEYFADLLDDDTKEFRNKIVLDETAKNNLYDLCLKKCDNYESLSYITKKSFVLSLFAMIEPFGLLREKEIVANKDVCKKIISYIEENYTERLTVGYVAEHFGYSKNYFSSLFNNLIGENFSTFLNKYRASQVARLKRQNPNMLIEDIIFSAGFSSRETYYRLLRKHK